MYFRSLLVLPASVNELDANRLVYYDVLPGICQLSGFGIAFEHLYDVAVAAGYEQVFAIGGNVEVARVYTSQLVAGLCQGTFCRIYRKNADAVLLQSVAGIEESAVRADVYVGAASCVSRIGVDALYLLQ